MGVTIAVDWEHYTSNGRVIEPVALPTAAAGVSDSDLDRAAIENQLARILANLLNDGVTVQVRPCQSLQNEHVQSALNEVARLIRHKSSSSYWHPNGAYACPTGCQEEEFNGKSRQVKT